MLFNFPSKTIKESVNIKIRVDYIGKARTLAEKHECTISEIYQTLIEEAINEYEQKFGEIGEKAKKKVFRPYTDAFEAGDGLVRENLGKTYMEIAEIVKEEKAKERKETNPKTIIIEGKKDDDDLYIEARRQKDTKVKALIRYCVNLHCPLEDRKFINTDIGSVEKEVNGSMIFACSPDCYREYIQVYRD